MAYGNGSGVSGGGSGGGVDMGRVWSELANPITGYNNEKINEKLLPASFPTSDSFSLRESSAVGKLYLQKNGSDIANVTIKLPTSLPASDVSAWAKASTKPTYKTSEVTEETNLYFTTARANTAITNKVTKAFIEGLLTGNITSHTHSYLPLSGGELSGALNIAGTSASTAVIKFMRDGYNYLEFPSTQTLAIRAGSTTSDIVSVFTADGMRPYTNNTKTLGDERHKWNAVYATTVYGALSGNASTATKLNNKRTIWGQEFDGSANVTGDIVGAGGGINIENTNAINSYSTSKKIYINHLSDSSDVLLCDKAGNVGIGTTTTSEKLTVAGNILAGDSTETASRIIRAQNQNGAVQLYASTNRGLYDTTNSKWMIDYNNVNARTELNDGPVYVANSLETADGATIGKTSAGVLNIKRTNASGGAYIQYFAQNQTAKYWQAGVDATHLFAITYTGTKKFGIDQSGNVTATGDVTAYSDKRLKSDIKDLEYRGPLEPKTYVKDGKKSIGFIAQEVRELYPELVLGEEKEDEYLSLNYGAITAVLAAENKELRKRIERLETLINKLIEK